MHLPLFEQSSVERIVSYGIYETTNTIYPDYKYVVLKFISFPPSKVIQRDEGFAILIKHPIEFCLELRRQGFAVFSRSPEDPPGLVFSFM